MNALVQINKLQYNSRLKKGHHSHFMAVKVKQESREFVFLADC